VAGRVCSFRFDRLSDSIALNQFTRWIQSVKIVTSARTAKSVLKPTTDFTDSTVFFARLGFVQIKSLWRCWIYPSSSIKLNQFTR